MITRPCALLAVLPLAAGFDGTCYWDVALASCDSCGIASGNVNYHNLNGYCDDGGPGSEYDFCALGTDCTDCGTARRLEETAPQDGAGTINDAASFAAAFVRFFGLRPVIIHGQEPAKHHRLKGRPPTHRQLDDPSTLGAPYLDLEEEFPDACPKYNSDCWYVSPQSSDCPSGATEFIEGYPGYYQCNAPFYKNNDCYRESTGTCCVAYFGAGDGHCCMPNTGVVVGVAVGASIGGLLFLIALVMCCVKLKKKKKSVKPAEPPA